MGLCSFFTPLVMENTSRYEYRHTSFYTKFMTLLSEYFYGFLSGWWFLSSEHWSLLCFLWDNWMHRLLSLNGPQFLMTETKHSDAKNCLQLSRGTLMGSRWALERSWSSVQGLAPALRQSSMDKGWVENGLGAALLLRRTWRCWLIRSLAWPNVLA